MNLRIYFSQIINPPPRSGEGIIGMAFVRLSVRPSVCLSVCPSGISCPLCISYTPWRISFIFCSNVHQVETTCRAHAAVVPSQGQGHTWRSKARTWVPCLSFRVRSVSPIPHEGFLLFWAQMFTRSRRRAEPMPRLCRLKVKVTLEGQRSHNHILTTCGGGFSCLSDCLVVLQSHHLAV